MPTLKKEQLDKYLDACAQPQSNYAIEHLIDGAQLTPERRFRQAVIELNSAENALRSLEQDFAEANLDLEATEHKARLIGYAAWLSTAFKMVDLAIRHQQNALKFKRIKVERLSRSLLGRQREMEAHLKALVKYQEELGFTEDTPAEAIYERLQAAEGRHYATKLSLDAAAQIVAARGGPHMGVLLAMQQLPPEDIGRVTGLVEKLLKALSNNEHVPGLHDREDFFKLLAGDTAKLENKDS